MTETRWTVMVPTVSGQFWGEKKRFCTHYQSFKGLKPVTSCTHTYFTIETCILNSIITLFSYIASIFVNWTIKIIQQKIKPILAIHCFWFRHLIILLCKWTINSLGGYKIPHTITLTNLCKVVSVEWGVKRSHWSKPFLARHRKCYKISS